MDSSQTHRYAYTTHTHTERENDIISADIFVLCSLSQGVTFTETALETQKDTLKLIPVLTSNLLIRLTFSYSIFVGWEKPGDRTFLNHVGNEMESTLGLKNSAPRDHPQAWISEKQHSQRLFSEAI